MHLHRDIPLTGKKAIIHPLRVRRRPCGVKAIWAALAGWALFGRARQQHRLTPSVRDSYNLRRIFSVICDKRYG